MSVEFQFSLFGQTDRQETQTVAALKQIEKKNSNKLVCFWDFFYRGKYSPHVFLGNEFGLVEAFCVYLLFLLSIKKFLVCNW